MYWATFFHSCQSMTNLQWGNTLLFIFSPIYLTSSLLIYNVVQPKISISWTQTSEEWRSSKKELWSDVIHCGSLCSNVDHCGPLWSKVVQFWPKWFTLLKTNLSNRVYFIHNTQCCLFCRFSPKSESQKEMTVVQCGPIFVKVVHPTFNIWIPPEYVY